MRGKDVKQAIKLMMDRITPAYAGKSFNFGLYIDTFGDHPRVCGEKNAIELELIRRGGSPPRMRGKEGQAVLVECPDGITPAYAGKSA